MNITMIAGTFYLIFLFLGIHFRIASWVTVLIVIIYVGLSGAGIPIQRAGYGAVLILLAALAGRPPNLLNSLCFAFFSILLFDPKSLWNIGFQLSFLCVFSLILILPVLSRVNAWTLSLGSSLAVLVGTFPAVLYHFNIFSPVSVVANLAAIPLCDAALFTALFALLSGGIPYLSMIPVKISSGIISASLAWVQWLSVCRWGYWFFQKPPLILIGAYYANLVMILFCTRRKFPAKRFCLAGLFASWIILTGAFFWKTAPKTFEMTILASGQNGVAHMRFSNGAEWLLNAGRNFPSDQGEWLIGPYLRSQGTQRLEGVLMTDLAKKSMGGLVSTLRGFPAGHVLYPRGIYGTKALYADLARLRPKGQRIQLGDAVMMGPEKIQVWGQSPKGIAVLVSSGPWRIFFVSRLDPEFFSRKDIGEIHAVFLPASKQGLPDAFREWFEAVKPALVVLSDASTEIRDYFISQRTPCLDLKEVGALSFRKNGSRFEVGSFLKGPLGFYAYPEGIFI